MCPPTSHRGETVMIARCPFLKKVLLHVETAIAPFRARNKRSSNLSSRESDLSAFLFHDVINYNRINYNQKGNS